MTDIYDDIINLPHHVSSTREQMPMIDRAAQFSPFAALTGYGDAIKETGRLTDEKIDLDEDSLAFLNMRFQKLADCLEENPEVSITYFVADEKKPGGAYTTVTGTIKRIDDFERIIIMRSGLKVPMDDVISLESEVFPAIE